MVFMVVAVQLFHVSSYHTLVEWLILKRWIIYKLTFNTTVCIKEHSGPEILFFFITHVRTRNTSYQWQKLQTSWQLKGTPFNNIHSFFSFDFFLLYKQWQNFFRGKTCVHITAKSHLWDYTSSLSLSAENIRTYVRLHVNHKQRTYVLRSGSENGWTAAGITSRWWFSRCVGATLFHSLNSSLTLKED